MLKVITVMLVGIMLGRRLKDRKMPFLQTLILLLIWWLLFLLGLQVGHNHALIAGMAKLGGEAFVLTVCSLAGSLTLAWLLWRYIQKRRETRDEG